MNLLISHLRALHVKFTHKYAEHVYQTTPRRNTLWGLAKMLRGYNIKTIALRIENKDKVKELEMPWIAETSEGFAIVLNIHNNHISYISLGKKKKSEFNTFQEIWTGVALIPTDASNAIEPEYAKHLKNNVVERSLKITAIIGLGIFLFSKLYSGPINLVCCTTIIFSVLGTLLSLLLLIKHLGNSNHITERVCDILSKHGCSNVLESKGAYVIGSITWSECGIAYFAGNIIIAICYPSTAEMILPWSVVCALPLTFWSISYQATKVKSWCTLCVLTMITLWCMFITLLGIQAYHNMPISLFSDISLYLVPCIYITMLSIIHFLVQSQHLKFELNRLEYESNTIKADIQVFRSLLQQQKHLECPSDIPALCFGQFIKSAPQIWVVSNPYCTPCARAHEHMDRLLQNGANVHYLMTTFNEELLEANKYIMAYYHKFGPEASMTMLTEWFKSGKELGQNFFEGKISEEEAHDSIIEEEIQAQLKWIDAHHIHETPYILIDGYKKPDIYSWDDIVELLKDTKS